MALLDARIKLLEVTIEKMEGELKEACDSHDERVQLPYSCKELLASAAAVNEAVWNSSHKHDSPAGAGRVRTTDLCSC